ncbi:MAG: HEAT repeat domain-containing protein, partial [Steroidobacteraceae bacterium]
IGGRAALETLIECASSGSFFRTFPAIDVLGRSGDPRAVAPLARLLADPQYLPEAARALARTGERASVKPLLALLDTSSDAIVRVAVSSLAELRQRFEEKSGADARPIDELIRADVGPELIRRLARVMSTADVPEAIACCKVLGAAEHAEAAPLLAILLDGPPALAACAAAALKKVGAEATAHLLQAVREGSSARRKVLLPVVTRSSAAPDVASCLDDADPEVRTLACDTLARLGDASVVPRLFRLLEDTNLRVVHSATAAIQALSTREGLQLGVEAAGSANAIVRRSAVRILAYFGDDIALVPILAALEDSDARVREAALQGLPYLADRRALEALFEAIKSLDSRTRAIAARSLGHVVNVNERVYSLLLKGLADADAWVRYYACQSLGRLGYGPAAPQIAKLTKDEAGQVRVSAVESLAHLDSADARQALRAAAAAADLEVK